MVDLGPFWLSVRVAGVATICVVSVGTPLAYVLARRRFPGKGAIAALAMLPMVLPPTVLGYGLLLLLGRRSPIGAWLESAVGWSPVFHWSGAVIASAVAAFPLFVLPARSAFEGVATQLEDVARLLGRGECSVFTTITLPLALRGILAGVVLAFVRALGDFGATLMLAGDIPGRTRTASLAIYDATVNRDDGVTALVLTALLTVLALLALVVARTDLPGGATRSSSPA